MTMRYFTLLALPLLAASARTNYNLTVAFFPDDQVQTCEANDTSEAITVTTNSYTLSSACFNVSTLFSQDSDTGFQDDGQRVNPQPQDGQGVNWTLTNRDNYDSSANYSRIWIRQVNLTGEEGPGLDGIYLLTTYAFDDCQRAIDSSPDADEEEFPWFESSCQTGDSGECQSAPNSIKSFRIEMRDTDGCVTWTAEGGAAMLKGSFLAAFGAVLLAYMLVL